MTKNARSRNYYHNGVKCGYTGETNAGSEEIHEISKYILDQPLSPTLISPLAIDMASYMVKIYSYPIFYAF